MRRGDIVVIAVVVGVAGVALAQGISNAPPSETDRPLPAPLPSTAGFRSVPPAGLRVTTITTGHASEAVNVIVGGDGSRTVAWTRRFDGGGDVQATFDDAATHAWRPSATISTAGVVASSPQLLAVSDGGAVLAWREEPPTGPARTRIAARRPAGKAWALRTSPPWVASLAALPAGALLAISDGLGPRNALWAAVLTSGATRWSRPVLVGPAASGGPVCLASSERGDIVLSYVEDPSQAVVVQVLTVRNERVSVTDEPHGLQLLDPSTVLNVGCGIDEHGSATVAYATGFPNPTVAVFTRPDGGAWHGAGLTGARSGELSTMRVVAGSGRTAIVWGELRTVTAIDGGSRPVDLARSEESNGATLVLRPDVAVAGDGATVAVWLTPGAARGTVLRLSTRLPGVTTWARTPGRAVADGVGSSPRLALSADGAVATVAWAVPTHGAVVDDPAGGVTIATVPLR